MRKLLYSISGPRATCGGGRSERGNAGRGRIAARDPDDWPTLALALKLGVPIWSQDKDFSAAGVGVVTIGELLDSLRAGGHDLDEGTRN